MAAKKSSKSTDLTPWQEELAKRAEIAQKTAESQATGSKTIGLRGGVFTVDGDEVVDNVLNVVVLDHCAENAYYPEKFDPDNLQSPTCFAFGRDAKTMAPNADDVPDPQSDLCKNCEFNVFGSADTGRGKACKNLNRLMLVSEDDLEDLSSAEVRMLKVPVTSGPIWNSYVKQLAAIKKPPLAVVTRISIVRDPKTQFKLKFEAIGDVSGDVMGEVLQLANTVESAMFAPYTPREEEEAPAKPSKATRGTAQQGKATAKRARR